MKYALLMLLPLLVLLTGCQGERMTAWALSSTDVSANDNEFVGRIGVASDVEIGLQSDWIGMHGERQWYGVYILADIGDPNGLLGQPYVGAQASLALDEDGGAYGPIVGTKFPINERVSAVTEGWYRDFNGKLDDKGIVDDEWKALFGMRIKF